MSFLQPDFLLPIEQVLLDDSSGTSRAALVARLRALAARLSAQRRHLNPPARQKELAAAHQAVESAIDALLKIHPPTDGKPVDPPVLHSRLRAHHS